MSKSDRILAAVAIVSVVIYSLACRPAWHPSGKSIAFHYVLELTTPEGDKAVSGVAVYDVETGEVKRVYEDEEIDFAYSHVLWTQDGEKIIATAPREGKDVCRVLMIDPVKGKAETIAVLPDVEIRAYPPALRGAALVIGPLERGTGDGKGMFYAEVDLDEWRVKEHFISTDSVLCASGATEDEIFYIRAVPEKDSGKERLFIGRLGDDAEPEDIFELPEGDYNFTNEIGAFVAVKPDATAFAVLVGKDDEPYLRVLDDEGKIVKDIAISASEFSAPGYLAWLGDSVWIGASREGKEGRKYEIGLIKVAVDSGDVRFISLGEPVDENTTLRVQPSLSPDGGTIAVSGIFLRGWEGKGPIGLVLIDAAAPEKELRYIRLPLKEGEVLRQEEPPSTDSVLTP